MDRCLQRHARVLSASGVEPSSIAAVGLTGYGNGLFLVDRHGRPVRNAILSPDLRAQAIVARWRAEGAEARSVALTYNSQFPGKPLPLIAWLEAHEPEALERADRALFCKDYLRFREGNVTARVARFNLAAKIANDDDLVCAPSVSARDHPAHGVALPSFYPQLPRCGRSARRARFGCLLRIGETLGIEIWAVVRPLASP